MHYLYIIYTEFIDKYYVGESPDDIKRLHEYNSHYFEKTFTKAAKDWKIILSLECDYREDALYLEKYMKRMNSKRFI